MWTLAKNAEILKTSWTEKVTNKEVLVGAKKTRSIRFGSGNIDDLGMFSGMTTYRMTLSKGKCWAKLLVVGKGQSFVV